MIGLEVHVELLTQSKMFCRCSSKFGAPPNSHTCPGCLGLPGTLPILNGKAVELGIKTALALGCEIPPWSIFERKSYFYPDLSRNFQISQFKHPLAIHGILSLSNRSIRIQRVHLEEDTGKLLHNDDGRNAWTGIDFNRSGLSLMEIVTEPDIESPEEAEEFLRQLKRILTFIEVSDCSMEEGSLRCDANLSLKRNPEDPPGTKTEVKNLNSFKSVRRALAYEEERQKQLLTEGKQVIQETRLWDENNSITTGMRSKEEAHDYRYFPDPDLPILLAEREMIEKIRGEMPELPSAREERFIRDYALSSYDSALLTSEKKLADYFEESLSHYANPRILSNWMLTVLLSMLNLHSVSIGKSPIEPLRFAKLVELVETKTINSAAGKKLLEKMWESEKMPETLVKEMNLLQISDPDDLKKIVKEVIQANPKVVADIRNGKTQAVGFLIGKVMQASKGKANPGLAKEIALELIDAV